jgi:hypothetical protein
VKQINYLKYMKMKKFIYAFLILATLGISSCSKDDNNDSGITNSYSYDGNVTNITYAAKLYDETEDVYVFIFSVSETEVYDNQKFLMLMYDAAKLGVRCNLNESGTKDGLPSGIYSKGASYLYFAASSAIVGDRDDNITTATNNWVQVTKNSTSSNNFTIEFEITLDGKPFKGSFQGDITNDIPAI